MPIVVNGTTIPENVANVLNVNGTNITSVVCDGATVWTQNLFSALWSGNSYTQERANLFVGLEVSGSSYRYHTTAYPTYSVSTGAWGTVNSSGIFTGDSIYSYNGFSVSGSNIRVHRSTAVGGWVSFTSSTHSFSGSSTATIFNDGDEWSLLQTSGGLIRFGIGYYGYNNYYGSYISLT